MRDVRNDNKSTAKTGVSVNQPSPNNPSPPAKKFPVVVASHILKSKEPMVSPNDTPNSSDPSYAPKKRGLGPAPPKPSLSGSITSLDSPTNDGLPMNPLKVDPYIVRRRSSITSPPSAGVVDETIEEKPNELLEDINHHNSNLLPGQATLQDTSGIAYPRLSQEITKSQELGQVEVPVKASNDSDIASRDLTMKTNASNNSGSSNEKADVVKPLTSRAALESSGSKTHSKDSNILHSQEMMADEQSTARSPSPTAAYTQKVPTVTAPLSNRASKSSLVDVNNDVDQSPPTWFQALLTWTGVKKRKDYNRKLWFSENAANNANFGGRALKKWENKVASARYTIYNFLPNQLVFQFRKVANAYFLLIAGIQQVPGWSPTGQYTSIAPLSVFVAIAMAREAYDDIKRNQSDQQENVRVTRRLKVVHENVKPSEADPTGPAKTEGPARRTSVSSGLSLRKGNSIRRLASRVLSMTFEPKIYQIVSASFEPCQWQELAPGDLVKILKNELIPADIILLGSSEPNGICYIETSSLDGEQHLKQRQASKTTFNDLTSERKLAEMEGFIEAEPPNHDLYTFNASITLKYANRRDLKEPLSVTQLLPRGSSLRNTDWVYGMVVYSGEDTKLRKNANKVVKAKSPHMEKTLNKVVAMVFGLLFFLALLCFGLSAQWSNQNLSSSWYLRGVTLDLPRNLFAFVILFNTMIPISLYVTLEMVKLIQCYLMNNDLEMYHEETDTPAKCQTNSLNEDLGQVAYIFSDKTGTLTDNIMSFEYISVAGNAYKLHTQRQTQASTKSDSPTRTSGLKDALKSQLLMETAKNSSADVFQSERCLHFLEALTLCQTVIPSFDDNNKTDLSKVIYQSSSPDEEALIKGAQELKCIFFDRSISSVTAEILGKKKTCTILNIIEFSSKRKRMTVIYRYADGSIVLLCKGADSIILERSKKPIYPPDSEYYASTMKDINLFALEGYRTLMYAQRVIPENEYKDWAEDWDDASTALTNRQQRLEEAADKIEQNLTVIGATAIEDRLQKGVPDAVDQLRKANIIVWMLTGDKRETAINIGKSCCLIKTYSNIVVLEADSFPKSMIANAEKVRLRELTHFTTVIDGDALTLLEKDPILTDMFAELTTYSESVICCRVSPSQKAWVIRQIKQRNPDKVTLAIGDGANDVAMIQEADVGIGITGREGLQAAKISDYSIAQFAYLKRLLLVHGHWSYYRVSTFILFSFHKSIAFYLTQAVFQIFDGFSSSSLYEQWTLACYNILFSSLPVIFAGFLDKDMNEQTLLNHPELYSAGQESSFFNFRRFGLTILQAVYHAMCCILMPILAHGLEPFLSAASPNTFYALGDISYNAIVLIMCIKITLLESRYVTKYNGLVAFFTIAIWYIFQFVYDTFWTFTGMGYEVYGSFKQIAGHPFYWFASIVTVVIALLPEVVFRAVMNDFSPGAIQVHTTK